MGKIISSTILKKTIKNLKKKNLSLVVTNGCFDIIHPGHIKIFEESKKLGDKLIVLVNTDKSIKKLKGKTRPIISLKSRLKILSSIEHIDYLVAFDQLTPVNLYNIIKPNFLTKGSQYKIKELAGEKIIKKNNGKIKLIKMISKFSTSNIINKIKLS